MQVKFEDAQKLLENVHHLANISKQFVVKKNNITMLLKLALALKTVLFQQFKMQIHIQKFQMDSTQSQTFCGTSINCKVFIWSRPSFFKSQLVA